MLKILILRCNPSDRMVRVCRDLTEFYYLVLGMVVIIKANRSPFVWQNNYSSNWTPINAGDKIYDSQLINFLNSLSGKVHLPY